MGSHARWRVAAVAGAMGTLTVVAGGGVPVAQACSTAAPCTSTEHLNWTGFALTDQLSIMRLRNPYLPSYTAGERINLHYKTSFESPYTGGALIGFLDAGVAVGGPLVATPYNTSTPVYYKRSQVVGGSPIETNYTDGPGSGYFAVGPSYNAASSCWTEYVGPHTSSCLSPLPSQASELDQGLSTNSAATNYKANADMYGTIYLSGGTSPGWSDWPAPTTGGVSTLRSSGSGATCGHYDNTSGYVTVGVGTGVTC
jgi:hypothetical protein